MSRNQYQTYFEALINEMCQEHYFSRVRRVRDTLCCFSSDAPGFWYYAQFQPRHGRVNTGLEIVFRQKEKNESFFDVLREREAEINVHFTDRVYWLRYDGKNEVEKVGCSIGVRRDGHIASDAAGLAAIKAWHIEHLLKCKAVFTPEIRRVHETLRFRGLAD